MAQHACDGTHHLDPSLGHRAAAVQQGVGRVDDLLKWEVPDGRVGCGLTAVRVPRLPAGHDPGAAHVQRHQRAVREAEDTLALNVVLDREAAV